MDDFEVHPIGTAEKLREFAAAATPPVKPTVTSIDWRERALKAEATISRLQISLDAIELSAGSRAAILTVHAVRTILAGPVTLTLER